MKVEIKKETLWIHNLWLIEEGEKTKPDTERMTALKKVVAALTAPEPTEEQRQIMQRLAI